MRIDLEKIYPSKKKITLALLVMLVTNIISARVMKVIKGKEVMTCDDV